MKKMAEIMEELGFRPEASDEVKKAFIKNLIKQAYVSESKRSMAANGKETTNKNVDKQLRTQMSLFDKKNTG